MPLCSAYKCKNRSGDTRQHKFPKDENLANEWVRNVGRANFKPSKASCLCTKHFEPHCYRYSDSTRPHLKKNAIPTIFEELPDYLKKKIKQKSGPRRSPPKSRSDEWEKKMAGKKLRREKEEKIQREWRERLQKSVKMDHNYSFSDVDALKRKYLEKLKRVEVLEKQLKHERVKICRFKKYANSLKEQMLKGTPAKSRILALIKDLTSTSSRIQLFQEDSMVNKKSLTEYIRKKNRKKASISKQ